MFGYIVGVPLLLVLLVCGIAVAVGIGLLFGVLGAIGVAVFGAIF